MSKSKSNLKRYEVDVITPVFGGAEFLESLIQPLLYDVDAGVNFRWILIDDATPKERGSDEVLKILRELKEHEDVTVIENKVNGGFAKSNNLAVVKGRAEFILMLNSDIIPFQDGWMAKMVENFKNPMVAVVGARLLFFEEDMIDALCKRYPAKAQTFLNKVRGRPPGTVQHAGVTFNLLGQPYHIFLGWPADHPKVMEKRAMRTVTGACLMTRRELWKKLGGLAEVYGPGNFEDVEYCVLLFASGRIILYDPEVALYHFAGGSDNSATAVRNQQIFQMRVRQLLDWDEWVYYVFPFGLCVSVATTVRFLTGVVAT